MTQPSMKLRRWDEVIFEDFPGIGEITKEALEQIVEESSRYRGSVRMATGRIWIDAEYEAYREEILKRRLP